MAASPNATAFSAARWHRERRRQILEDHPEVRALLQESDAWVRWLGAVVLPAFGWMLWHAPDMTWPEAILGIMVIGSLRANWAIYCGHAISHGRWTDIVGQYGSLRFNCAIAATHLGHLFQVSPNYWLLHQSHHTKLGTLPLLEARQRAKQARQTDGDLGIASRLFSPPARKYRLVLDREGRTIPRQSELSHQAISLFVHALAPLALLGYVVAAIRADAERVQPKLRNSLVAQAAASLAGYALVTELSLARDSPAPLALFLLSSFVWLSPLNPNWIWTCPHLSKEGTEQPTVSFYTPDNGLGALLDLYMGYENYHVEHHDFPEMPMYLLPQLRRIAPEYYDSLRQMPVLEWSTWRDAATGDFFYACQDATFGLADMKAEKRASEEQA